MAVKVRESRGAWWVVIDWKGRRKSKRVGVGKAGKRAAEAAAEQIQAKLALGDLSPLNAGPPERLREPFREAARRWLAGYAASTGLVEGSRQCYERALINHAFPRFGDTPVGAVTREAVKAMVSELRAAGRAASTVKNVVVPIHLMYAELAESYPDLDNPAVKLSRLLGDKRRGRQLQTVPLTPEEETCFLDTVREHFPRYYPLFLCALRTGLRIGELLALKWGDLDFHGRFIEVRRSWSGRRLQEHTKTGKIRRVDMSRHLAEVLQHLLVERKAEKLRRGWEALPEWVFCSDDGPRGIHGGLLEVENLRHRIFYPALEKAGLRHIRLHDLRHTFASRLIQNGESLAYVKEQMGHTSITMTVDVYGHLIPGANKAAVDRLDATSRNLSATAPATVAHSTALTP